MKKMISLLALLVVLGLGAASFPSAQAQDLPTKADLTPNEWNAISPGGETLCSRGTDYTFFVRPGDESKLMIYFQGGGACWNGVNCSQSPLQTFDDSVTEDESQSMNAGLFDFENPQNPASDFTTVAVSYCTGDIHVGDSVVDHDGVEIHHNGLKNTQAVLDWVYTNYPTINQLFVTGCSAGSYGSIFYAPSIANAYPDALFAHLGDSGIGVLTPDFEGLDSWGFFDTVDAYYPSLADITIADFDGTTLYEAASALLPERMFTQYTATEDFVQISFYQLMGGATDDWSPTAQAYLDELTGLENFAYYTAPGSEHCIIDQDRFYEVTSREDAPLVDWVRDLMNGVQVENISAAE